MTAEDTDKQSRLKDGGKVVCIDDAYQRPDRVSTPDGLLIRGQVYNVAGTSICGGVLLTGLRAISLRSGKDVGFEPSRFLTQEQYLQFPGGQASIPDGACDFSYLDEEEVWRSRKRGEIPKEIDFPEISGLMKIKPQVNRALNVLETMWDNCLHEHDSMPPQSPVSFLPDQSLEQIHLELQSLLKSSELPELLNLQWRFWNVLLNRSKPTVLFCRERSPLGTLIFLMTRTGSIFKKHFADNNIQEEDFPVLMRSAGQLLSGPIRICDAREPDTFLKVLVQAQQLFEYAVCDWPLADHEWAAACRLTQDSSITFICPLCEER